jgi:MoxR-like ATPase
MTFAITDDVAAGLRRAGYATDPVLVHAIWLASKMRKPILVEGPPGTGKTYLAQVCAAAAETELIRLQCFEGITGKEAIGLFDEALQRLFLETQGTAADRDWETLRGQLHTLDFFVPGPLLQAVLRFRPVVLLIDELDKVDQKFEALLLEIISDWQITVPKLGTVTAKSIPFVVMTSNQERRLGDPLRHRSLNKRIEHPDVSKESEILDIRTVDAPLELKAKAVGLAQALRGYNLVKPPSIRRADRRPAGATGRAKVADGVVEIDEEGRVFLVKEVEVDNGHYERMTFLMSVTADGRVIYDGGKVELPARQLPQVAKPSPSSKE